jgi:predicted GNAT family N-acyltransferase
MRTALAIRSRVFVDEQGVPLEEEIDAHDRTDTEAVHAIVRDDAGAPLGTGRYYRLDARSVQLGRMAIDIGARGRGAGALLLAALLDKAHAEGFARVHLDAQVHARAFYVRAGFTDDGAALWDAGILHQPMSKALA